MGILRTHYENPDNRNTPPASHFTPVPDNHLIPRQYGISSRQWSEEDERRRQADLAEYAANRAEYIKNYGNSNAPPEPPEPPAPVPAPAYVKYYKMKPEFIKKAFEHRNEVYFYEDDDKSNSPKHGRIMSMPSSFNLFGGKYKINTDGQIYKVKTVYTNNYDYSTNKKGGRPIKKVSRKRITRRRRNGKFSAMGSRRRTGQRGVKRK
jgi:hypothetical protein